MKFDSRQQVVLISLLSLVFSLLFVIDVEVGSAKRELVLGTDEGVARVLAQNGRFKEGETYAVFNNQLVGEIPQAPARLLAHQPSVLGLAAGAYKWIEVDLSDHTLLAHEDGRVAYKFLISSGKWGRTPTGVFRIWSKMRYCLIAGGSRHNGTYYYLPNVPYTMYFYKDYALHGTYWHDNFGHPMSHGCVNLETSNAEKLFYWAHPEISENQPIIYPTQDDPGTPVIIHD